MVFHQNGTTITYWADENTDWNVRGIISNAINPAWVIILTPPLIAFWKWLDARGLEPATPIKMVIGMAMTSLAFLVLFLAAKSGEATVSGADIYAFKVSPAWLLGAYGVLTLGELMLSPMGLSLVSKVAPRRLRGMMMGGWFVATGLGNKLTQIARVLDGVEALDVLARAERRRRSDGGRAAHPVEAAAKGHAGGVRVGGSGFGIRDSGFGIRDLTSYFPQPSALSPQPSALSPQPSALSPQPSALSPQPSALSPEKSPLTIPAFPTKIRLLREGLMRSSPVSMLRGATWLYIGSLAAIGSVALFTLCYNLLNLAVQLASSIVDQLAREL